MPLAVFAGLDEVPAARRALLAELLIDPTPRPCRFPELGHSSLRYTLGTGPTGKPVARSHADPVLVQVVKRADDRVLVNLFNTGSTTEDRLLGWRAFGLDTPSTVTENGRRCVCTGNGIPVQLRPYQSRQFVGTLP